MRGVKMLAGEKRVKEISDQQRPDGFRRHEPLEDQIKGNGGGGQKDRLDDLQGPGMRKDGVHRGKKDQEGGIVRHKVRAADRALKETAVNDIPLDLII